jgi:nitrogen PTS system EIIA component
VVCPEGASVNVIARYLQLEDVVLDVVVASKAQLLEAIGRHMERSHGLPHRGVVQDLARREQVGSTGVGDGVAIPHARFSNLDRILVAYMRLMQPVPYASKDSKPVSDVLVLLVPKAATEEHIRILAEAARMFGDQTFRKHLRNCNNPMDVKQLFDGWA